MKHKITFNINTQLPDYVLDAMAEEGINVFSVERKVREKFGENGITYESEVGYGSVKTDNLDQALDVLNFLSTLQEVDPHSEMRVDGICVPLQGQVYLDFLDESIGETYHYTDALTEILRSASRICDISLTVEEIGKIEPNTREKIAKIVSVLDSDY